MKKALQGFWRGGLLGGLLGVYGGLLFKIGKFLHSLIQNQDVVFERFQDVESLLYFLLYDMRPALMFGLAIGAVLGIPFIFFFEQKRNWQGIVGAVIGVTLLHLLIIYLTILNRRLGNSAHYDYYDVYVGWKYLIWISLLYPTILYGYYFPKFNPRWPKFLRKKVKIEGEEVKQ